MLAAIAFALRFRAHKALTLLTAHTEPRRAFQCGAQFGSPGSEIPDKGRAIGPAFARQASAEQVDRTR